ncbi:MAG: EAL domain-containing protein [Gammaproteobacteria bacterium]|nr:EAL domain-containing protein [Gammaproteobacteria bacterium]
MTGRERTVAAGGAADSGDLTAQIKVLAQQSTGQFDLRADGLEQFRALLVCRDKSSQKWGPRWLRQSGIQCSIVTEPDKALQAARSMVPDVIIVEASLTDRDGDALYQVFADAADLSMPVCVLCSSTRDVTAALDADAFDVVRKPFDWQLLSRRARTAIVKNRHEQELAELRDSMSEALLLANQARKQLRESESFEPLTGLPKRSKFVQLLEQATRAADRDETRIAVITIGFGRFRLIVEAMGSQFADRTVSEVAERLSNCLYDAGDLQHPTGGLRTAALGNTGAEQFALMFTCSRSGDEIDALQRRISDELAKPVFFDGQSVHLTAHLGIACYPEDACSAESLLVRSETAMSKARARGSEVSFYSAAADAQAVRRLQLEHMLLEALDRGELRLAYQPLNDMASNRIVAVEALLRWPQADGSFIGPDEFVPVAEDAGLMKRIGTLVVDAACRQLRAWRGQGIEALRMCVNVSKCQLMDREFPDKVRHCLEEHGVPPASLDLELSERGVLSDNDDLLDILLQLKRIGVTLSLDDFGTGDAAIAYLKELPVDTLKIDRSYIGGLANDGKDKAITAAIIAMGQKLGMSVVAEGVETSQQLDILATLGCDQYQGFYCSPAVAPETIVAMLHKQ